MWRRSCLLWAAVTAVLPAITTVAAWEDVFSSTKRIWRESRFCQVVPGLEKVGQLEVVCEGIKSLSDAGTLVDVKQQPRVTTLTVTYSNLTRIALDDLQAFPALTTLSLNNSVTSDWASPSVVGVPKVTCLILDRCWDNYALEAKNIKTTRPAFALTLEQLNMLPDLKELYIVESFLYHLDRLQPPPHIHIIVEGGGIECRAESLWVMDWVSSGKADVSNSTRCFVPTSDPFHMKYSFVDKFFLITMGYWKEMERDCPERCKCLLNGIRDNHLPMIGVNCSGIGLSHIPESIPAHSHSVYLDNNTITNFTRVFTHPLYRNVDKISLTYNKITSMDGRLFYQFAHNRSLDLCINLSHNQLSKFPVKEVQRVYDEALERDTQHLPIFVLGYNPWDCDDCSFLPGFQKIVYHIKYSQNSVRPYLDIRCKEGARSDLAMQQVMKLDVVSLCRPDPPLLTPMDVLVICLAILLILFLLNFLHNFFQYRRHGKLPWIITKLPSC